MTRGQGLLRLPHFRRLFAARLVSSVGNGITPIALAFGVLAMPGATPTDLSIVLAAQALPLVVMLPLGGVVADRFGRAWVIGLGDLAMACAVGGMALLFLTSTATVPLLAGLAAVAGLLSSVWYPAFTGLVPEVAPPEHLQSANSYLSVATNGGLVAGNALGGLLVASVGAGWAIAIDACTYLAAGLLVLSIRRLSTRHGSGQSVFSDLAHGWRVFISYRWVVVIVASFSLLVMSVFGAMEVMGPVLALEEYNGAGGWALVLACHSAGLIAGGIVGSRVRVARPMLVGMLVLLTFPLWVITLALAAPLPVVALLAFVWGVGFETFAVLWFTALHENIPRESMSRVAAYDAMGSLMFGPIGLALAGPLIAVVGLAQAFVVAGVLATVAILGAVAHPAVRARLSPGRA